jgi:hypothetical protein
LKRRDFLIKAGLTGVGLPVLARAALPCPPPSVSVSGGTSATTPCTVGNAMSDWLARIGGPGVVWYNGFESDAEMNLYRWASAANGNDPNATAPDAHKLARGTTGGPGGTFPYISITRPAGAAEVDTVWWRPFSPLTGASNGRGVDDPAAGGTIPLQTWAPQGNVNEMVQWDKGWYSQNSAIADGTDFYLQTRIKMDPNASASGMNSPCKLLEIGASVRTFTDQNLVTYLNGSNGDPTKNYHRMYLDYNVSPIENDDLLARPGQQVGGDLSTNYAGGAYCDVGVHPQNCWYYSGGWDTLLYHITPGPATAPSKCAIQVYAARQGATSYTKLWDMQWNQPAWYDPARQGWNALYFATYSNGFNQPRPFTSGYAQVILSKQFIPCPQV